MIESVPSIPRISIGLPVRNGGKYLKLALDSLLEQTEQDFEIIISDNGSDDGSSEFLRAAETSDRRVRYIRQDPQIKAYDNFHYVLQQARGEYFMWAAHDDTRDADFVACMLDALSKNKESILAFGDLYIVTPDNPVGKHMSFPFQTTGMCKLQRIFKMSRMQCFHIYGVWRTSALRKVPYAYCSWWPDLPIMLAASVLGSFVYIPGTSFRYLEVPKSNLDRIKHQDYNEKFNLIRGVTGLVAAVYRACTEVDGVMVGVYAALLVIMKQAVNFPGYLWRRIRWPILG